MIGGAGNDHLSFRAENVRLTEGELSVTMDGGAGNDVLDAFFALLPGSRGHVNAMLFGGTGDDFLTMLFSEPPEPGFVGLIDGGKGFDRARISHPVKLKNVEEISNG